MTNYNERLDEILYRFAVDTHESKPGQDETPNFDKAKQAFTSLTKELVAEAIGDDYPKPTRRYSGGIWLGDKQISWLDIEEARRHYQARNIEKSELRNRLHAAIKALRKEMNDD
mgnify:CR=1 FL=1